MSYFLLTNNPVVKEYVEKHSDYYIEYTGETIQSVISRCEELFMTGEYALAADPMGGRKARPFPYLTVILDNNAKASLRDWSRIADFSAVLLSPLKNDQKEPMVTAFHPEA